MIIFDLDGTLANCDHRRHFVDPKVNPMYKRRSSPTLDECKNNKIIPEEYINFEATHKDCVEGNFKKFIPDWNAFYEACDKDDPIHPVVDVLDGIYANFEDEQHFFENVQIWSGRSESVREKTMKWLCDFVLFENIPRKMTVKMRPIGDSTPDDQLKEKWLDAYISLMYPKLDIPLEGDVKNNYNRANPIIMAFDDRPKVIRMWRRRGIFVFNCCQHDREF